MISTSSTCLDCPERYSRVARTPLMDETDARDFNVPYRSASLHSFTDQVKKFRASAFIKQLSANPINIASYFT